MTDLATLDAHGVLTEPTTLKIQRLLPGPIERVWAFVADGEQRRQWLAAGDLPARPGQPFELVWRNDELSHSATERPEGFAAESRATCQLLACEPPRHLRFAWPGVGEVSFDLRPAGDGVLLTVTHIRLPDADTATLVSAGWHQHLDILVARAEGRAAPSFWSGVQRLRAAYAQRLGS